MSRAAKIILSLIAGILSMPASALACTVCYGEGASAMFTGARYAVMFLLAVIAAVLVAFAVFFLSLRKRAKAFRESGQV